MDESRVRQHDKERESEATSKKTLEDLEESQNLESNKRDERLNSPDGSFDEDDELSNTGPM